MQEGSAVQSGLTLPELYETYETDLRRYARNLSADSDWADDLVSETILKALPRLSIICQMNTFQRKAWLFRVLKNQFLDDLRARKRQRNLVERLGQPEIEPPASELLSVLGARIPAQHRKVLQMRYTLDMTSEEIGQKLGVPAATVRSRLRLAIQWLKNHQEQGD